MYLSQSACLTTFNYSIELHWLKQIIQLDLVITPKPALETEYNSILENYTGRLRCTRFFL